MLGSGCNLRVHNRFRDLDERWKSASTGRRNRLPHLLRQTIDPARRWGRRFRLPFQWHNQWSASKMNKFPKTVKHPWLPALNRIEVKCARAPPMRFTEAEALDRCCNRKQEPAIQACGSGQVTGT